MSRKPLALPTPRLPVLGSVDFASQTKETKGVLVRMEPTVRRSLKHLATDLDRTVQSLMLEAIDMLLERHRVARPDR